jgi:signal transduction histidine kinase
MADLLAVEGCSIFEWSRETDTLFVVAEYSTAGFWEPGSAVQVYELADYPLRKRVLAERTAHQMTLTQPGIDSTEREHMQGADIKTLLLLPVVFQDRVIGLIEITDSQAERVFTDHEVSVVQLLANQAAIAMENARLYEQAQREIMERKRTERALARYTVELERSNEDLQQFAYVASHDLQEPLRMVTSYVQLLARRYTGKLDADADEFIHYAVDGATRMHELIRGLLAYSRVGTHGDPFEPTDCQMVLEQVLDNLQVAIEEKAAGVTYDPLPTVMADATQLGQLFQNLVSNSIKFHGDQPPRIHVSAERQVSESPEEAPHWLFSVQDNGIGIEPQYLERVFVIFQRLHPRESYPGTGMGLTICKRIVERHGGRIWAESVPGRGSTFYFTLPDRTGA